MNNNQLYYDSVSSSFLYNKKEKDSQKKECQLLYKYYKHKITKSTYSIYACFLILIIVIIYIYIKKKKFNIVYSLFLILFLTCSIIFNYIIIYKYTNELKKITKFTY